LTDFNVGGNVSITLGSGVNETVKFNATTGAANNVVGGLVNLSTSGGAKTIWVDKTNVTGPMIVYGGHSNSGTPSNALVYINQINDGVASVKLGAFIYSEAPTNIGSDTIGIFDNTAISSVSNAVRITAYGQDIWVGIAGATIQGATTINISGGGANTIALSAYYHDAVFNGAVIINNKSSPGTTHVWLDNAGANINMVQGIAATLGMGNDTVTIGGSGGMILGPGGTFDGGPGTDEWDCDPLHHTGVFVFTNFEVPAPPRIA
jgi:hypothetical protein